MECTFKNRYGKYWRNIYGELHREDGPAIEGYNGDRIWYINGKRHRKDGPAVEYWDGSKEWYLNGKRHREDGPAIECTYPSRYGYFTNKYWFLNGMFYSREDYYEFIKCKCGSKFKSMETINDMIYYCPKCLR